MVHDINYKNTIKLSYAGSPFRPFYHVVQFCTQSATFTDYKTHPTVHINYRVTLECLLSNTLNMDARFFSNFKSLLNQIFLVVT